jgi:two-component system chemotaxis response regulator CheB
MIRVLLADDSALVLSLLEDLLCKDPEIEIVGQARNGAEAVAMARRLSPDIILMDVRMPVMDGIRATGEIMADAACPILVLSANVLEDTGIAYRAIQAGAIDVVEKPVGTLSADYGSPAFDLISRVKLVSKVPPIRRARRGPAPELEDLPAEAPGRMVLLGTSTGGPPALAAVLGSLPESFPAPVLAVQHISVGFLQGFVDWLDSVVAVRVKVAERGERPLPGTVYFAPEQHHLVLDAQRRLAFSREEPRDGHRPSASVLFESAAEVLGPSAIGVLMTGMGSDGAAGLLKLKEAGGRTICQDEESCIVFGMPSVAIDLGAAETVVPLDAIAAAVATCLT